VLIRVKIRGTYRKLAGFSLEALAPGLPSPGKAFQRLSDTRQVVRLVLALPIGVRVALLDRSP
jgi:hypothetical protein